MKVSGVVKPHKGNGRKFGYPTANIAVDSGAEEGVFVGYTTLRGGRLPSIIFIGTAETLGETNKRLESYILDFPDEDLYDELIEVEVLDQLRDNQKFDSIDDLIEQMHQDERNARDYFANLK